MPVVVTFTDQLKACKLLVLLLLLFTAVLLQDPHFHVTFLYSSNLWKQPSTLNMPQYCYISLSPELGNAFNT